jgi:hypothetical protein
VWLAWLGVERGSSRNGVAGASTAAGVAGDLGGRPAVKSQTPGIPQCDLRCAVCRSWLLRMCIRRTQTWAAIRTTGFRVGLC